MKRTKSIKRLGHTRKVKKRRKDGVKQSYWVGRKVKAKRGFKKLGYKQLKKRGWKGRRLTDTDGDRKVNVFDCKPLDARRQDVKKVVHTHYSDSDRGFNYTFEPIEDSIKVKKTKKGYEVKYITLDQDIDSPSNWADDNLFLVHYHRDFWVENKNIITKDDLRDLYQTGKSELQKEYYMFPVKAYIHGGISLSLGTGGFMEDAGGWDTSHVGAVLASKKEFPTKKKAEKVAKGLIETWNQYLMGDVYGIVKETYDKNKNQIDQDSVWGFYGQDYALKALKTDI